MFSSQRHILSLSLLAILILPVFSLAAENSSSTASSSAATTSSEIITEPTPITPAVTGGAVALSPVAQTRIRNLTANLSNREDAAVRRLENVSVRLESRMNILTAEGRNVDAARIELEKARASLALAKSSLATIDKAVETFIGSATPRESWTSLKLTYTAINTNLRAALTSLGATLAALESAPAIPTETATTTSSSTGSAL